MTNVDKVEQVKAEALQELANMCLKLEAAWANLRRAQNMREEAERELPEKQGKYTNRLLLSEEQVQLAARSYLTSLPTGEVTPLGFCHMLNVHILPSLGYTLMNGLSECTI